MKQIGRGTIIGQGTHGVIEVDDNDDNYVFKKFKNQTIKFCNNLKNEFDIQLLYIIGLTIIIYMFLIVLIL